MYVYYLRRTYKLNKFSTESLANILQYLIPTLALFAKVGIKSCGSTRDCILFVHVCMSELRTVQITHNLNSPRV